MKYFGTDGIRGIFKDFETKFFYKIGFGISKYFGKGEYIIGRDTRPSGKIIQKYIAQGIIDSGGNVILVGILPTPAVAFVTKKLNAKCGIMVSASHNPPQYNGIKIFNNLGTKPSEQVEQNIEDIIDSCFYKKTSQNQMDRKSKVSYIRNAKRLYQDYLIKSVDEKFEGISIVLDCANGAASTVAKKIFERVGAKVVCCHDDTSGIINHNCGSMHPHNILNLCKVYNADIGFALDGDADRLIVATQEHMIDGDTILYNLSRVIDTVGNVVVGTVLNNTALQIQLQNHHKKLVRTPVGDKYIIERMLQDNYTLGGEQSGHYIIRPFADTGDGLLTALFFLKAVYNNKSNDISNAKQNRDKILSIQHIDLIPQQAIALYATKDILQNPILISLITKWEYELSQIKTNGRLIVRMSGTEPKIRVMCECINSEIVKQVLQEFEQCIIKITHIYSQHKNNLESNDTKIF